MDFLTMLLAVMNDDEEVHGLPTCIVIGPQHGGEIIQKRLPDRERLKIARLMIMIDIENETSQIPDRAEISSMVDNETDDATRVFMNNCVAIRRDSANRIMMLDHLIVEIVRKAIPGEVEYLDTVYYLAPDSNLMRLSPQNQQLRV